MRRFSDGNTLLLAVAPTGAMNWIQRVTIHGKRHDIGLGSWPLVPLAEARDLAFANRQRIRRGENPLTAKHLAKRQIVTFQLAAEQYHAAQRPKWKTAQSATDFLRSLAQHVFPRFGLTPVDKVTGVDVIGCLLPIWTTKPTMGKRVKQRVTAVFDWAQAHGHVQSNPCAGIGAALPAREMTTTHHAALPYQDVADALRKVAADVRCTTIVQACFRFLVLTGVRSGEARGARWSEIDLEAREWRIPADRMKAKAEHRVPLSDAACAILAGLKRGSDDALVFPSRQAGKQLSDMSLLRCLEFAGLKGTATIHGFRTSFRTWASEQTDYPHAVCEHALAHTVGSDVERSYARSDLFERRRGLMADWAAYVIPAQAGGQGSHREAVQGRRAPRSVNVPAGYPA